MGVKPMRRLKNVMSSVKILNDFSFLKWRSGNLQSGKRRGAIIFNLKQRAFHTHNMASHFACATCKSTCKMHSIGATAVAVGIRTRIFITRFFCRFVRASQRSCQRRRRRRRAPTGPPSTRESGRRPSLPSDNPSRLLNDEIKITHYLSGLA